MIKHVAKCDGCGREVPAIKMDKAAGLSYKPPQEWIHGFFGYRGGGEDYDICRDKCRFDAQKKIIERMDNVVQHLRSMLTNS